MSSEIVCQVARNWVEVGSLFEVVYVTCRDFHNGSEKGTASVHQVLCQSWEKCYGETQNDSVSLRRPNLESYAAVSITRPVQDRSHISWRWRTNRVNHKLHNTQGEPQATQLLKLLHEFKSSSVMIDVGLFTTLLRRWELVMGHANGFLRKNWSCTVSQLYHDNAPSHTSFVTQEFLAIQNCCHPQSTLLPW
jgi:hypothetical protein